MTDKPKPPETPGMAELPAKFVDEAEAAAAPPPSASVSSDPLIALGERWQEAYRNWYEIEPTGASNEEIKAQEERKNELGSIAWGIEDQAAEIPAQSIAGVLAQLRMAGTHYHLMERDAEAWGNTYAHLTWQAWDGLERLAGATAPQDARLEVLAINYYAAFIARDVAEDAREEVGNKAKRLDSEAVRIKGDLLVHEGLFLPFLFDKTGTLTPSREQVSQYCETEKLTEIVMRHLEKYGERCVAASEAAGWPEKQAEFQRAEQRMEVFFDQMVDTPAQGLRGIAAKVKGLVYPHEWEFLCDRKLDDFDDQINPEMLVSLAADVERLAEERAAAVPVSVIEPGDAVVALKQRWENVMAERDQLKYRDDGGPEHPDVIEDARLRDVQRDIEELIANTPTHTTAGIVAKLLQLQRNETEFDGDASWRPVAFRTALEALGRGALPDECAVMFRDPNE